MTTTAKHTPGPWHVIPDFAWQGRHPLHNNRFIATSQMVDIWDNGNESGDPPRVWRFQRERDLIICTMPDSANQKANARLIAAAPELLAACQAVYTEMGKRISPAAFEEFSEETKNLLASAIAKAEGENI